MILSCWLLSYDGWGLQIGVCWRLGYAYEQRVLIGGNVLDCGHTYLYLSGCCSPQDDGFTGNCNCNYDGDLTS